MNLDLLISKYIDGELTESEDKLLREMIINEPYAKELFDRAINVHLLIKEDSSSIETPPELKFAVKGYINSLTQSNNHKTKSNKRHKFNKLAKTMPILILLIAMVFRIDDGINNQTTTQSNYDNIYVQENSSYEITKTEIHNQNKIQNVYKPNKSHMQTTKPSDLEENLDIPKNFEAQGNKQNEVIDLTLIDEAGLFIKENENNIDNIQRDIKNSIASAIESETYKSEPNLVNILNFRTQSNYDVTINSFLSSELYSSEREYDLRMITNLSQSISYSINSNERMGIEVGYREYSYKENFLVSVPISALPSNIKVEILDHSFEKHYTYKSEVELNKKLFWGAAFYESTIFETKHFTFDTRIGIGSSNEGAMLYSRILSKYELFSGLSIAVGCSGMLYQSNFDNMNNKIQRAFSLTYGLQFKF